MKPDIARYEKNLREELDGSALYAALAATEVDSIRKDLFRQLSQAEAGHALLWRQKLIAAGVDPIHLGIIIVINSVLGSLTPPVGILVFICASIAKVPANAVFRECNPSLIACGIGLLVITYVPALSLTLWKVIGH